MMKKSVSLPVIILFSALLATFSCKKDEPVDKLLLGKWKVQSVTVIYYENNVKIWEQTLYSIEPELIFQFSDGGTGTIYEDNEVKGAFTWQLKGDKLALDMVVDDKPEWKISIDKNTFVWSFEEYETTNKVLQKLEYIYTATKIS